MIKLQNIGKCKVIPQLTETDQKVQQLVFQHSENKEKPRELKLDLLENSEKDSIEEMF